MPLLPLAATVLFLLAPSHPYVRPGEPVAIRFLTTDAPAAAKIIDAVGPAKAPDLVNTTPDSNPEDLFDSAGKKALYTLYPLTHGTLGEPIAQTGPGLASPDPTTGILNLDTAFPQIKEPGTYVLTWKSATPLVIETLRNPAPWGYLNNPSTPPANRQALLIQAKTGPAVAIHIVPLQFATIATDKGDITAVFDYANAPHTVENFISLASQNFYDGSNFHRIIKNFMLQGGDSTSNLDGRAGSGGPGYNLAAEFSDRSHTRGTLSMARLGLDVDTAGSQFFIIHHDSKFLDNQYTPFGQVLSGLDLVDKLADTPVSDNNGTVAGPKPKILSVKILPATPDQYGLKK